MCPSEAVAIARPLYTALAPLRTATSVVVEGVGPVAPTAGFQPSMLPLSVSKRNRAGAEWPAPSWTTKPVASVLNTWPVGVPDATSTARVLLTVVAEAPE